MQEMSDAREILCQAIKAAFEVSPPPDPECLCGAYCQDPSRLVKVIGGKRWLEVSDPTSVEEIAFEWSFLTDEARSYYLPSLLLTYVVHYRSLRADAGIWSAIQTYLYPSSADAVGIAEWDTRWRRMSAEQRRTIRQFYEYLRGTDPDRDDLLEWTLPLNNFWWQFE